jgi:hypothetical protein
MLTEKEMDEIAREYLLELRNETLKDLVILSEFTIRKKYGNIYQYTSRKHFETKDDKFMLLGNAPFLVENTSGRIVEFGTARSDEYYFNEYEEGRWPNNRR